MRGGRHKARKLQPGVAGAYAQGRWWGKHAASPAHTARDTERRARLADTGGSEPCDALLRAVLAVAPHEQQAAAARMGLPCLLLNTAYDTRYKHRHQATTLHFIAELRERGRGSREAFAAASLGDRDRLLHMECWLPSCSRGRGACRANCNSKDHEKNEQ